MVAKLHVLYMIFLQTFVDSMQTSISGGVIGFKRGATLNEIIEEVKAIKFDREGGIIGIQGGRK